MSQFYYTGLQIARMRRGKTLKELSGNTGIPVSRISKADKGKLILSDDEIQLLSSVLGFPPAFFAKSFPYIGELT